MPKDKIKYEINCIVDDDINEGYHAVCDEENKFDSILLIIRASVHIFYSPEFE